jgi:hypothetical protein
VYRHPTSIRGELRTVYRYPTHQGRTSYCVQTPHQPSGRTSSVGRNLQLPEKFVGLVAAG